MRSIFAAISLLALTVFLGQSLPFNPPAQGVYVNSGSGWNAWNAAASFGALTYAPPATGIYCQSSATSPWTPCIPGQSSVVNTGSASNTDFAGSLTVPASGTTALTPYTFTVSAARICVVSTQTTTASSLGSSGPLVPIVSSTTLNVQFANAVASNTQVGYICVGTF
jgi:hypothetical protein